MAGPEQKVKIIFQQVTVRHPNLDESQRLICAHTNNPNIELLALWKDRRGEPYAIMYIKPWSYQGDEQGQKELGESIEGVDVLTVREIFPAA